MKKFAQIKRAALLALLLFAWMGISAPTSANGSALATKDVAGKTLRLIGSGLREFLFIDIYNLSAYSESGDCSQKAIIYNSEVKLLVLAMKRTIPKDRLVSTLRDTFTKNLPEGKDNAELLAKIDTFLSYFKADLAEGSYVEIIYIPGRGTMLKQNGVKLGEVTKGKGFADLVWKSYFGPNTCCSGLKSAVIGQCKKAYTAN